MELPNLAPAKARIQAEKQEKLLKDILLAGLAEQIVDKILTDEFFQSIPDAVDEVVVTPAMWGTHDIDITAFVEAIKARMVVVINGLGTIWYDEEMNSYYRKLPDGSLKRLTF